MPSEREIELRVSAYARYLDMLTYKFTSPSNRGVPDRVFLYKGHTMFIEFKRTRRKKLDPLQNAVRRKFSEQGFIVQICNDIDEGKVMLLAFKNGVDNVRP